MSPAGIREAVGPVLWTLVLLALGSVAVSTAWSHWLPMLALICVAWASYGLVRLLIWFKVSGWVAATGSGLLLILVAYLMGSGANVPFRTTLVDAVPRLLTSPQPYALHADLLIAPVLFVGFVAILAALANPVRSRVVPVAAAGALYLGGTLLTAGSGDRYGLLAIAIVVTCIAGWTLLDHAAESTRARLRVAIPLAVIGVIALSGMAIVPAAEPFEPRDYVTPPLMRVDAASPMPQLTAWGADPDGELFRVTGDAQPLRLATLDVYDGSHWLANTQFAPFGTASAGLEPGRRTVGARDQIELTGLGGYWLPSPGEPEDVSLREALIDPQTGTLYLPDSVAGASYQVSGLTPDPTSLDLLAARVPVGPEAAPYLALPPLPEPLRAYATKVTAGAVGTYERALAIETAVREGRTLTSKTLSGSAIWRLQLFLLGKEGKAGAQSGTSEQFASAFALLARANGLPARVVVGFRPGTPDDSGVRTIRGRDALAWPEIYFEGLGWIPFSPLPDDDTFTEDRPFVPEAPKTEPEQPQPTPTPTDEPKPESSEVPTDKPQGGATVESPARWPLAFLALVPVLCVATARQLRSRRQRRGGPIGVWSEVVDAVRLGGFWFPARMSAVDVAAVLDQRFGVRAGVLAVDAERAAFAPPPVDVAASGTEADLAAVLSALRGSLPWWRRWAWYLDPRVWLTQKRRPAPARALTNH